MNENNPQKFTCFLNTLFTIGETLWEGLKGIDLEESHHWGTVLRFQESMLFPVSLLLHAFGFRCEPSATASVPILPAYCHCLYLDSRGLQPSGTLSPKLSNLFYNLPWA